jgi:hypothetical protein
MLGDLCGTVREYKREILVCFCGSVKDLDGITEIEYERKRSGINSRGNRQFRLLLTPSLLPLVSNNQWQVSGQAVTLQCPSDKPRNQGNSKQADLRKKVIAVKIGLRMMKLVVDAS